MRRGPTPQIKIQYGSGEVGINSWPREPPVYVRGGGGWGAVPWLKRGKNVKGETEHQWFCSGKKERPQNSYQSCSIGRGGGGGRLQPCKKPEEHGSLGTTLNGEGGWFQGVRQKGSKNAIKKRKYKTHSSCEDKEKRNRKRIRNVRASP